MKKTGAARPKGHAFCSGPGLFLLCVSGLLLASCTTAPVSRPPTVPARAASQADYAALDELELWLTDYHLAPDPSLLERISQRAAGLATTEAPGRFFAARLSALLALSALAGGEAQKAAAHAETAVSQNAEEPRLWLLKSRNASTAAARLAILAEGLIKNPRHPLLLLEQGHVLFIDKQYQAASEAFEAAFLVVKEPLASRYARFRTLAWELAKRPAIQQETAVALQGDQLSLASVIRALASETGLTKPFLPNLPTETDELTALLVKAGLAPSAASSAGDRLLRKEVAAIVAKLVARAEQDPRMLEAYTRQYPAASQSPIPDVAVSDPAFTAIMALVERNLMELPDGTNFYPDRPLSTAELFSLLAALKSAY